MDFVLTQTYLGDILRIVSDALLGPAIVLLLAFIVYAVFCIGSIIVEAIAEHRNFKVQMPRFLASLADADQESIPSVIEESGLLNRQKLALLTVFDYRTLPGDMLIALVKRLLNEEETHYQRIVNRNNVTVRVAPMLGLMGTLIPLGPGIAALGQGDVASLSSSLIIAFNTTVAGLAAAAVCLVIARIRKTWYGTYMNALESAMASLLYKIGIMQDAGEIAIEEPSDHAFLYQKALKRRPAAKSDGTGSAKAASELGKAGELSPSPKPPASLEPAKPGEVDAATAAAAPGSQVVETSRPTSELAAQPKGNAFQEWENTFKSQEAAPSMEEAFARVRQAGVSAGQATAQVAEAVAPIAGVSPIDGAPIAGATPMAAQQAVQAAAHAAAQQEVAQQAVAQAAAQQAVAVQQAAQATATQAAAQQAAARQVAEQQATAAQSAAAQQAAQAVASQPAVARQAAVQQASAAPPEEAVPVQAAGAGEFLFEPAKTLESVDRTEGGAS